MLRALLIAIGLLGHLNITACAGTTPVELSRQIVAGERYMGIRLWGALRLPDEPIDGLKPGGLSGLAWDEDENILYVLSDSGQLFHLRPDFHNNVLVDTRFIAAYPLQDAKGRSLRSTDADSEGLAIENARNGISGDSRLIISFEHRPRIVRYSPTGKWLGNESLPLPLHNVKNYSSPNEALEAVTLDDRWGLLTAPEQPMQGERARVVPIFAATGHAWSYPLYKAPNSALVGMEALPDGSLLTLERAFVSLTHPLVITLRRTRLTVNSSKPLAVEEVAIFDTSKGWLLDNFEGLTRHRDWKFFMISDDNNRVLQSTLLVYFELLPSSPGFSTANDAEH